MALERIESGATSWISQGLETLLTRSDSGREFDVVIVGSGYGGAIAAAELAGYIPKESDRPLSICVLERGNEYLPGSFPAHWGELPKHLRFNSASAKTGGVAEGLFDFRIGGQMNALLANGLGGGSLINAGVMLEPDSQVFDSRWPVGCQHNEATGANPLDRFFQDARKKLAVQAPDGDLNAFSLDREPKNNKQAAPQKMHKLAKLASASGKRFQAATLSMEINNTSANETGLNACIQCGDCAMGCNYGAKKSLDTNLLQVAARKGAQIFTGATVLKFEKVSNSGSSWSLSVTHTSKRLKERLGTPVKITAKQLIIAAGSYGSTELLMRSQSEQLQFSERLGGGFSSNGDMIAAGYPKAEKPEEPVNAVADERDAPTERQVGPTITGMIDLPAEQGRPPMMVQELAAPGAMGRLFSELVTTGDLLHNLGSQDKTAHTSGRPENDPAAVNRNRIKATSIYAVFGDDGADGELRLVDDHKRHSSEQGGIKVQWPGLPHKPLFDQQVEALEALSPNETIIPNPLWRLLPKNLEYLNDNARGPLLSVHPLGGCRMADSAEQGVVNSFGQVYQGDAIGDEPEQKNPLHSGLLVLDGSIIPCALGANPALTIAAVALRAIEAVRADFQHLGSSAVEHQVAQASAIDIPGKRPYFRDVLSMIRDHPEKFSPPSTLGNFTERLNGELPLAAALTRALPTTGKKIFLEVTLDFISIPLPELYADGGHFCLQLTKPSAGFKERPSSRLRLFDESGWHALKNSDFTGSRLEELRDKRCLLSTELHGALHLFEREASSRWQRIFRAGFAWFRMRGFREIGLAVRDASAKLFSKPPLRSTDSNAGEELASKQNVHAQAANQAHSRARGLAKKNLWRLLIERAAGSLALASRAGEVRLMRYKLQIGKPLIVRGSGELLSQWFKLGEEIHASKRISYRCFSSPWAQLATLPLSHYPGQPKRPLNNLPGIDDRPKIAIDYQFMVDQGQALFRIDRQHDQATALGEISQWSFYLFRLLLSIHIWSLRAPDKARDRSISRLPQPLKGMPSLTKKWFTVDHYLTPDGEYRPASMLLSRYPNRESKRPPVLLIHGYSASGTTFTHHSIRPNLATVLGGLRQKDGRDVWVLDMRGSPDIAGSSHNWALEDLAHTDIPLAVDWICRETGFEKIDIVAHCMGAAMLSMGILACSADDWPIPDCDYVDRLPSARKQLPNRIRRIVMTQVGPVVMPTPLNRMRGYLARFLLQRSPNISYNFRPGTTPSLPEQLLDRIFAVQDYPRREMQRENPLSWRRVEHVGTRRRIDGLFGKTFELNEVADDTLRHLDDLFGPTNLATIAQVAHFARWFTVARRDGSNYFVDRKRLREHWKIPTLYMHGAKNSMMDVANSQRMAELFEQSGMGEWLQNPQRTIYTDHGHQDLLIGKNSEVVFNDIADFLDKTDSELKEHALSPEGDSDRKPEVEFFVHGPWSGPVLGRWEDEDEALTVSFGVLPSLAAPVYVLFIAVNEQDGALSWQKPLDALTEADIAVRKLGLPDDFPENDLDWLGTHLPKTLFQRPNSNGVLTAVIYSDWEASNPAERHNAERNNSESVEIERESIVHPLTELSLQALKADRENWLAIVASLEKKLVEGSGLLLRGVLQPTAFNKGNSSAVRIAFGSCQYPRGLLDQKPAMQSWRRLGRRLQKEDAPGLLLQLGDQIYTDATGGLFDPVNLDDRFRAPYQNLLREPAVAEVLRQLPSTAMLDDHEIVDNWEPDARDVTPGLFAQLLVERCVQLAISRTPSYQQLMAFRPHATAADGRQAALMRDRKLQKLANSLLGLLLEDTAAGSAGQKARQLKAMFDEKTVFWEPLECGDDQTYGLFGLRSYLKYQRSADRRVGVENQKPEEKNGANSAGSNLAAGHASPFEVLLDHAFNFQGVPLYVVNTRSEREHRGFGVGETSINAANQPQIISRRQMQHLKDWLLACDASKPKIIASPSIFLPRHTRVVQAEGGELHSDSWDGFPASQAELLRFIVRHELKNVVFLSGDEHLGVCCQATLTESINDGSARSATIISLHSTALYSPYPFANARPEDLLSDDVFDVPANGDETAPLVCEVQSLFQYGQGFSQLDCEQPLSLENATSRWLLSCQFDENRSDAEVSPPLAPVSAERNRVYWSAEEGMYCRL